ncbi:chromosome partitioning protein ParB [Corynebacterium jeikeium K411]|uniref:Chromosome partitioning protein ParB n=2 Tax=Corynebacterium jeikeium TaxID=38289 RepID=Q4JSC7_CORJK|nr:chromosome partitioning protein ParB [Corynebacterium jeikeium K411]
MGKRNKKTSKLSKKYDNTENKRDAGAPNDVPTSSAKPSSHQNLESSLPNSKPSSGRKSQNNGSGLPSESGRALGETRSSGTSRKPQMPSPNAVGNARRAGLGRGLASLIPTGPARPSLGDGAADIVLGGGSSNGAGTKGTSQVHSHQTEVADGRVSAGAQDTSSRVDTDRGYAEESISSSSKAGNEGTAGTGLKRHSDASAKLSEKRRADDANIERGGVSSLEPTNVSRETPDEDFGATYQELPLSTIRTNAKQPREVFDEEALKELVHSIKEFGLMQPIVVRRAPNEDSTYELIMGERRLRAAKRAGFDVIPAIVRETADDEMLRDALLENIHRVQLNPLEEAAAYQQLMEEFGVTQEQLAKKIGRSRPLITNMIRLLQLPVSVQRRVGAGVLSAGHARALLGLKSGPEEQERLATRVVSEGLSVRATEEAVTLLNRGDGATAVNKSSGRQAQQLPEEVSSWVDNASDALDTKVRVQMGKKKGKIVVEFGGPEDFDRIIELLKFKKH